MSTLWPQGGEAVVRAEKQKTVGVFRLQQFKPSETFISAQARHLERHAPIFIGRRLYGPPALADIAVPSKGKLSSGIDLLRLQLFRDPTVFLQALNGRALNVLHAHFAVDGVFAAALASKLNVPLVTTLHGFDVTRSQTDMLKSGRPSLVNGVLFRRSLIRRSQLFLCVSDFIRRKAIDRGFPEDRLKLHYIGIDTKDLQPRPLSLEEPGLIVHVGRLVEKKGTIYLIRALSKIQSVCGHAKLVIIGDGPLRRSLEDEAQSLGLRSRCWFLGAQPHDQVLSWMRRASLVAVPSVTSADGDSEGLPTVNFEAAACGVPVVAFDSGGIRELVKHQYSGLLIREKDTEGLAEGIRLLLHDDGMRISIGANARDQVMGNFDIRVQTRKLEDFYDDASKGWLQ